MTVRHKVVKIESCFVDGVLAQRSTIEISLSPGIPTFDIVGLCDSSIRESRGRITSAVRSMGFLMPKGHITVNITPAYMHKSGSGFDLPIALGILFISGVLAYPAGMRVYAQGELSLSGDVRGTPGAVLRLMEEARDPADIVIIPEDEKFAAACSGVGCMCVKDLSETCAIFEGVGYNAEMFRINMDVGGAEDAIRLSELYGQPKAMEAVVTACAGMHSILLMGSPGAGKTMAAQIIEGLLPPLDDYEARQVMAMAELSGDRGGPVRRPFRRLYSNCTASKLTGKVNSVVPGELALANNGVIFADEINEFPIRTIEELKVPLEEHTVRVVKDGKVNKIPASFLFVAACNPCKCGMMFEEGNKCRCTPTMRKAYLNRLSGAFLDRIDLFTEMRSVKAEDLQAMTDSRSKELKAIDEDARARIDRAWKMQERRYFWSYGCNKVFNGTSPRADKRLFKYSDKVSEFAATAAKSAGLSGRGFIKLIKVARTIADMEGSEEIDIRHVRQALIYKVNIYET
ncbi:magnesium chelatase family protein [Ruminococcaceae bacterium YRB3002]|nr:magnesium chelatase family protein [Ruminococcaceae bacterium YRB3002]